MKRILAILMAFVMIFCITGCKNKAKTKTNESKSKTTQAAVKKTEEKAKTEKSDASDKEDTEDAEQTDDKDQKSDDGETKREAKQTSNTGTSGNGSTGNSGGNQSSGSSNNSGNAASATQAQTTTTTAAPKQVGYTEADAQRFVAELKAYAVSIGWTLDPSLGPNNSGWGAEWSIDLAAVENGSTWMSYDNMMAKAKQELAQPIWGDYFHTINITYYNSGNGSWTFVPYTL